MKIALYFSALWFFWQAFSLLGNKESPHVFGMALFLGLTMILIAGEFGSLQGRVKNLEKERDRLRGSPLPDDTSADQERVD